MDKGEGHQWNGKVLGQEVDTEGGSMTILEAHEDHNVVDVDTTMEDTFLVFVQELDSGMLANALLEADKFGLQLPLTRKSTVEDIAAMIVDGYEDVCQEDIASYWRSNFIVAGLL